MKQLHYIEGDRVVGVQSSCGWMQLFGGLNLAMKPLSEVYIYKYMFLVR